MDQDISVILDKSVKKDIERVLPARVNQNLLLKASYFKSYSKLLKTKIFNFFLKHKQIIYFTLCRFYALTCYLNQNSGTV